MPIEFDPGGLRLVEARGEFGAFSYVTKEIWADDQTGSYVTEEIWADDQISMKVVRFNGVITMIDNSYHRSGARVWFSR